MRIFLSVSVAVVLAQTFLTIYLTSHLRFVYLRETADKSQSLVSLACQEIQAACNRLTDTAYGLIYSDTNQNFMSLNRRASESRRLELESALKSLLTVIYSQKSVGVDFILLSDGSDGGVYSTIYNTGSPLFYNYALDFSDQEWFQDFQMHSEATHCFYANVRYPAYSTYTNSRLHVHLFRINPLRDTVKNIGYLAIVITDDFFQSLLGSLESVASDVLLVDENGNTLYESLPTMQSESLRKQARQSANRVCKNASGRHYLPMATSIGNLGWTLYCAVDVTQTFDSLQHSYGTWLLISCVLLLFLLCMIYHLCRRLTLPLKKVADGMAKVREGEYDVHLAETGNDEIGALTAAFNRMTRQLDEAHRDLRKYQMVQQSTAFYALQQQVNPHMLFNTLDMMIGMATQRDFEPIISACSCLASMFRYSLSRDLTVPLGEELNHIRSYTQILSLRNRGRIRGVIDCPESESCTMIPKLTLQPFVENSVKYAFEQKMEDCLISVCVRRCQGYLTVTIRDNGNGFPPEVLREFQQVLHPPYTDDVPGRHIGILNVCKRMNLIYGDTFSLSLNNAPDGGAQVHLRFPPDFPNNAI